MATKPATGAVTNAGALQRGKACLRCRKRKMRCDGAKPSCGQCAKAKKGDACEYDDGKGKTRTQLMRENIIRLEQRIRELEHSDHKAPVVETYQGRASSSHSSSSLAGSPVSTTRSAHSPITSDSAPSPPPSAWSNLPILSPSTSSTIGADFYFEEFQPPLELAQMLIDLFAPHRHQAGLEIHIPYLRESLKLPFAQQRHPALMNAIYLWACFMSRPEALSSHEDHYLSQATEAIHAAIRGADRLVDCIRAMCMLSVYFMCNNRIAEGNHYASAATAMSIQCGLHRPITSVRGSWGIDSSSELLLPPAHDSLEEGERTLAFWQVYNLDRCWSVVLNKPPMYPDGRNASTSINTPWPLGMAEYVLGGIDSSSSFQTVRTFLEGNSVASEGYSTLALRGKASALFQLADQLSANWDPRVISASAFRDEVQALEHSIRRFIPTLTPLHQLDAVLPDDRHVLITSHVLAHTAIIHLHRRFAVEDPICYEICLREARACVGIIKLLNDSDFALLDPILGPCWTCVSDILIRELDSIETSWPILGGEIHTDLSIVLFALTNLSSRFPFIVNSAAAIQKRLATF